MKNMHHHCDHTTTHRTSCIHLSNLHCTVFTKACVPTRHQCEPLARCNLTHLAELWLCHGRRWRRCSRRCWSRNCWESELHPSHCCLLLFRYSLNVHSRDVHPCYLVPQRCPLPRFRHPHTCLRAWDFLNSQWPEFMSPDLNFRLELGDNSSACSGFFNFQVWFIVSANSLKHVSCSSALSNPTQTVSDLHTFLHKLNTPFSLNI